MQIWREPESARVESQTLGKLAAFALSSLIAATNTSPSILNPQLSTNAFLPLLQDLVAKESYLEIRQATTNSPAEWAFAIRLDAVGAALWQTNVAAVVESATGSRCEPSGTGFGWTLDGRRVALTYPGASGSTAGSAPNPELRRRFTFTRSGDWSILLSSLSQSPLDAPSSFLSTIQSFSNSSSAKPSPTWLEIDIDPVATARALDLQCPEPMPSFSLELTGDGENVRSRGELRFARALPSMLEPWNVPTNLIGRRVLGLTAMRGTMPLFQMLPCCSSLEPRAIPSQAYAWDELGAPFHLYFALLVSDVRTLFKQVAPPLGALVNPRVAANTNYGRISIDSVTSSLTWEGLHHATPFLEVVTNGGSRFLYGGFGPHSHEFSNSVPHELVDHLQQGTNLVYYDFEITGQRLIHYRYLDDVYRILFDAHGPRLSRTASLDWMARNATNLSFAATELRREGAHRLSFARKSTVGLSGLEIDLLANWLELPEFPRGLSTLLQTNGAPVVRKGRISQALERQHHGTNSPAGN